MKIVIDIDKNVFTRLFDNGTDFYDTDDILAMAKAIRKGTPLPKGHGVLIDGDELRKVFENNGMSWEAGLFDCAPPIIEADEERNNKPTMESKMEL